MYSVPATGKQLCLRDQWNTLPSSVLPVNQGVHLLWNIQLEYASEQYLMKSSVCLCGGGELSAFIATKGISHQRALSWTSVCLASQKKKRNSFFLALSLGSPSYSKSNSCRNNFSSSFQNWIKGGGGGILLRFLKNWWKECMKLKQFPRTLS